MRKEHLPEEAGQCKYFFGISHPFWAKAGRLPPDERDAKDGIIALPSTKHKIYVRTLPGGVCGLKSGEHLRKKAGQGVSQRRMLIVVTSPSFL